MTPILIALAILYGVGTGFWLFVALLFEMPIWHAFFWPVHLLDDLLAARYRK